MSNQQQITVEYQIPQQILEREKQLEGMIFRGVLALGIYPPDGKGHEYDNPNYKGGLGTLIEERYYGYQANFDCEPDFAEAGAGLKATRYGIVTRCRKKVGSAGERPVLTMIPYDDEAPDSLYDSHLWHSCKTMQWSGAIETATSRDLTDRYGTSGCSRRLRMTLTGSSSRFGNIPFAAKRDREERSGVYVGYRSGLNLNEDLVSLEKWTKEQNEACTEKLVRLAQEAFSFDGIDF